MDKLLIFDQDGTIIDSFPAFYMAMKAACMKYGKSLDNSFVKHKIGTHGSKEILKAVLPDKIEVLHKEYSDLLKNFDNYRKVYPKVIPTLKILKSDFHIVMVTAKSTEKAIYHCKNLHIDHLFEKILGSPLYGKQDQIQMLTNEYNVKRKNCVMIGDSITDMRSAKKAGIKTILCLYGYGKKTPELLSLGDKQVNSFSEIPMKVSELC
ncbi:MAG: HAD family hydrolase [Candidatus Lokiarchaeota archaeon]